MKKIEKSLRIDNILPIDNKSRTPDEELQFILWKAELNKELMAFWKSIVLDEKE